jgi:hypothetical protein
LKIPQRVCVGLLVFLCAGVCTRVLDASVLLSAVRIGSNHVQYSYSWTFPSPASPVHLALRCQNAVLPNHPLQGSTWVYALSNDVQTTSSGVVRMNILNPLDSASNAMSVVSLVSAPLNNAPLIQGSYVAQLYYSDTVGSNSVSSNAVITLDTETVQASMYSPVANGLYGRTMRIAYRQWEQGAANTVEMAFTGPSNTVFRMNAIVNTAVNNVLDVDVHNIVANNPVLSVSNTSLLDGAYTLTFRYQDSLRRPEAVTTISNIQIRTSTPPPVLIRPGPGSVEPQGVFEYMLPVQPLPGSVEINLVPESEAAPFKIPLSNMYGNVSVVSNDVPFGVYSVVLSYADFLNNPVVSVVANHVTFDLQTQPPVLHEPVNGVYRTIPLFYTLPEMPLTASVQYVFTGTDTHTVVLSNISNQTILNPLGLLSSSGVSTASSPTLPDGNYSVRLSYQDVYGHERAFSETRMITVDTRTLPAVITSPISESVSDVLNVAYVLAEAPLPSSVKWMLSGAASYDIALPDTLQGSFLWEPVTGVAFSEEEGWDSVVLGGVLPDGRYDLSLQYQDILGNPVSRTVVSDISLQTPHVSVQSYGAQEHQSEVWVDFSLSQTSNTPIQVHYETTDATALQGTDYEHRIGDVVWNAQEQGQKRIAIPLLDNTDYNEDTFFQVRVSSHSPVRLNQAWANVVIQNDDEKPSLYAMDVSTQETQNSVQVPVVMNGTSRQDVTVHYQTYLKTPLKEPTHTTSAGNLVWPAGTSGVQNATVVLHSNHAVTGTTQAVLRLSHISEATVKRSKATLFIQDAHEKGVVLEHTDDFTAVQTAQSTDEVHVRLSSKPHFQVVVYCYADPLLYLSPQVLVFEEHTWDVPRAVQLKHRAPVRNHPLKNTLLECVAYSTDESYQNLASEPLEVVVHAVDTQEQVSCDVHVFSSVAIENQAYAYVYAEADGACEHALDVPYHIAAHDVSYASMYPTLSGVLHWDASSPGMRTVHIPLAHNDMHQGVVLLDVDITQVEHAAVSQPQSTVAVVDEDIPSVWVSTYGEFYVFTDPQNTKVFSLSLQTKPMAPVTVVPVVSAGLVVLPETVVFEPNAWNNIVTLQVQPSVLHTDNPLEEGWMTFSVQSDDVHYEGYPMAPVLFDTPAALLNRTLQPSLHVSDVYVSERDSSAVFRVSVVGNALSPVSVRYNTYALNSVDHTDVSGTLSWDLENIHNEADVVVPLRNDDTQKGLRTVGVVLSQPVGAALFASHATAFVSDDDMADVRVFYDESPLRLGACEHTKTVSLVLASKPSHDVVVVLDADESLMLSKTHANFVPEQWNVPQTVHVACASAYTNPRYALYPVVVSVQSDDVFYQQLGPEVFEVSVEASQAKHSNPVDDEDTDPSDDPSQEDETNTVPVNNGGVANSDTQDGPNNVTPTAASPSKRASGCQGGCMQSFANTEFLWMCVWVVAMLRRRHQR